MANRTLRHPSIQPSHPGVLLREDVLPAVGLSIKAAAEHMGISRQMLHRVLAEKASITPEMALRIGKFCGNGPHLWLAMQQEHDLWNAEQTLAKEIAQIETVKAA